MDFESEDEYRPGGFHPVNLGDFIDEQFRFKVVHKLGWGSFSTVWLCRDTLEKKWRAVKVISAIHSDDKCPDLVAISLFAGSTSRELEANHIALPLTSFRIDGPNGSHLCIVLPLFGPSTSICGDVYGCNPSLAKHVGFQMTEAMAYMHSKGICHGDFRCENILFKLTGIDNLSEEEMLEILGQPQLMELPQTDDSPSTDSSLPKHLVLPAAFSHDSGYVSRDIAVIDFGICYKAGDFHGFGAIPYEGAAPELLLDECGVDLGFGTDVWALGCAIYRLRARSAPFPFCDDTSIIENIEEAIGPMPDPFRSAYIAQGFGVYNDQLGEGEPLTVSISTEDYQENREFRLKICGSPEFLRYKLSRASCWFPDSPEACQDKKTGDPKLLPPGPPWKPDEQKLWEYHIPQDENIVLCDLLMQIFKYYPDKRAKPHALLDHKWFDEHGRSSLRQPCKKPVSLFSQCWETAAWIYSQFPSCMATMISLVKVFGQLAYGRAT